MTSLELLALVEEAYADLPRGSPYRLARNHLMAAWPVERFGQPRGWRYVIWCRAVRLVLQAAMQPRKEGMQ